jgi:hypothetical protein
MSPTIWKSWIIRGVLFLWGIQLIWLGWHFAPEFADLAQRAAQGRVGAAIRQEDPFYPWLKSLAALIPEQATYVFLDNYEAGKEIEARYFLVPRRHILLSPSVPADFLFYVIRQEGASFLIVRGESHEGPGLRAALASPAFELLPAPGPGRVFRVNRRLLEWGFYD